MARPKKLRRQYRTKKRLIQWERARRNRAQNRRRWLAKGFRWIRTGGGTMLAEMPGRKRYPSDDTYENLATGERVAFLCTIEAHFGGMPPLVRSLAEVSRRPGVKLHRRF
jgi:hypothetical protein